MKRILLIEDDDIFREMMEHVLQRTGCEVTSATNGKEGLQAFQKESYSLVITDLVMPEKEGIETIMELRRIKPEIKIIAMSGGGRTHPHDHLRIAQRLGAARVFEKPFSTADMLAAIRELLDLQ